MLKESYARLSIVDDETENIYEDEYDDTYDGLDISVKEPDELERYLICVCYLWTKTFLFLSKNISMAYFSYYNEKNHLKVCGSKGPCAFNMLL